MPKLSFGEDRQIPIRGKRYELIHRAVHLTPVPRTKHQLVVHNLNMSLGSSVHKKKLAEVWETSLAVRLAEDRALQPDLVFISNAPAGIIQENWIECAPGIVV